MKPGPLRTILIFVLLLVAVAAAWQVAGLTIEQDNESMQSDEAHNDPDYKTFQHSFSRDRELMVAISRDPLNEEQLSRDLAWLKELKGVAQVYFPSQQLPTDGFVSQDGKTAGILVTLDESLSREDRMLVLDRIRLEAPDHIPGDVYTIGLPLLKASVARHIARDQQVVTPLSGVVMMIMLAILFRRIAGVILPLLVIGLSLLSTLGLYAACGLELNSITSLLPPVVIVLSVSVAVHLFDAWIHAVDSGQQGEDAIRKAIRNVWKPCVFTALMTAAGLLSLAFSPIPAVRLFGLFSAIGVILSLIYAFILFPIGLIWARERPVAERKSWINRILRVMGNFPAQHPVSVLLVALVISIAAIWQGSRIQNNTDLIRFFKKNDPAFIAHDTVNRTLGSVRSLDLLVRKSDGSDLKLISDIPVLSGWIGQLQEIPDVVRTRSVIDFLPDPASIPVGDTLPQLDHFLSDDGRLMHVQVQLGDIGSSRAASISDRIRDISERTLGASWEVVPTGPYYQVVRDSNQLVATLLKSFGMTLIIVLVSTCLLFRSIAVLLPAFIPNILPIIWGAGLMGLLGIDLSTGTTMVAAVVIGLAVDDTIHYLHHFQTYRHLPVEEATRSTTRRIGRAVIVSSIVLVCGFWMGALGSFIPTNTFALLTGCMMISALFCDLLVLPAYLNLIHARPHPSKPL